MADPIALTPNQIAASNPTIANNAPPVVPAPAVVSSKPAVTDATNIQTTMNTATQGAVGQSTMKQGATVSYDPQGNMVITGGINPVTGATYSSTIPKGGAGYVANPKDIESQEKKQAALQAQINEKQNTLDLAKAGGYGENQQIQMGPDGKPLPLGTTGTGINPPMGISPESLQDQARWYDQNPQEFETWAKSQGMSDTQMRQVQITAENNRLNTAYADYKNQLNQIANGTFPLSPDQQAQLNALQAAWESTITAQRGANETYSNAYGMASARRGGEYDPLGAAGDAQRAMSVGINAIKGLQAAETEALANMRQGFMDNNFKAVTAAYNAYLGHEKAISDNLKTMYDENVAAQDKADAKAEKIEKDIYDQVTQPIQSISLEAAKNGASQDIIDQINSAKTVQEAIAAAGDSLQTATGVLGDYLQYKRQAVAKGLTPMDYQNYKDNEDKKASQLKISEAYSTAYASAKGKNAADAEADAAALKAAGLVAGNEYTGILKTILASGKFTGPQAKMIAAGIVGGDDPLTVVKNQAKDIMTSTAATQLQARENAQTSMKYLQDDLKAFYDAGGGNSSGWFGGKTNLFTGNLEKVINNLGEVKDPKLVGLATKIQGALQVYRNAISGTAYSAQEGKDINSIFPGINKSQGLNDAIIKARIEQFNDDIDGAYKSVLGSAYEKLKEASVSEADTMGAVDAYIKENPSEADNIAKMYEVPGATDTDIYNWLKKNNKIK